MAPTLPIFQGMPDADYDHPRFNVAVSDNVTSGSKPNWKFAITRFHIPRPSFLGKVRKRTGGVNNRIDCSNCGAGTVWFDKCMEAFEVFQRIGKPFDGCHSEASRGRPAAQALTSL